MPAAAEGVHLRIDALGGASGDMFLAALLDLRPDLQSEVEALAARTGPGLTLERDEAMDGGLRGSRIRLSLPDRTHGPHHYGDYVDLLSASAPDDGTRHRALDILRRLGEAEARVHGVTLEKVHFHEIADWDSVADVLLSAYLLDRIGVTSASTAGLPLGSGRVLTQHGPMPVPAPATLELLRGLPVIDDGIAGERITPTGAAIIAHLTPASTLPPTARTLSGVGYGFGTRTLPGMANALRLSLWDDLSRGAEVVGVVRFAVDDQTGEDLAVGLDNLRAMDGVLDVLQTVAVGKKGRVTTRIEVLCVRERLEAVARGCLTETTTIGVRLAEERRIVLSRKALDGQGVRLKEVHRPGGVVTRKAEMDDIAHAGDHAQREALRRASERSGR